MALAKIRQLRDDGKFDDVVKFLLTSRDDELCEECWQIGVEYDPLIAVFVPRNIQATLCKNITEAKVHRSLSQEGHLSDGLESNLSDGLESNFSDDSSENSSMISFDDRERNTYTHYYNMTDTNRTGPFSQ